MKISYVDWVPGVDAAVLVANANDIIAEYYKQGYTLTLRQLYYQFVSRDLIPNTEKSYKRLGSIITKARMAGMISWYAIEDRGRGQRRYYFEEDSQTPVDAAASFIEFDRWARQDTYMEVWVEKEALGNVIERACDPYRVPHLSCKGYLSASEAWRAGRRIKERAEEGKRCVILHLGDHDPSGIDMTRDNRERINLFSDYFGEVEVQRIALNMLQVEQYSPPPNPTKVTDTRAEGYIREYGHTCWELDALNPRVIEELITSKIKAVIDPIAWAEVGELEAEERRVLEKLSSYWYEVKEYLEGLSYDD